MASQELLEALFAKSTAAMLLADDERNYVEANQAACEMLGLSRDEILELKVEDLSAPELRDKAPGMFAAFLADGVQAGPFELQSPSGKRVHVSYSATANVVPHVHLSVLVPEEEVDLELDQVDLKHEEVPEGAELTEREREVLTLLALGETNQTIAKQLNLSPETIRAHTRSARDRLGARSRSHALVLAMRQGQLNLDGAS